MVNPLIMAAFADELEKIAISAKVKARALKKAKGQVEAFESAKRSAYDYDNQWTNPLGSRIPGKVDKALEPARLRRVRQVRKFGDPEYRINTFSASPREVAANSGSAKTTRAVGRRLSEGAATAMPFVNRRNYGKHFGTRSPGFGRPRIDLKGKKPRPAILMPPSKK